MPTRTRRLATLSAIVLGCGVCCLPLLVPLLGGASLASLAWAGSEAFLCGLLLALAFGVGAVLWSRRCWSIDRCALPASPDREFRDP